MTQSVRFLALAKKAGLLEAGEESVLAAAESGRARLIVSASDASVHSSRHAEAAAEARRLPYVQLPDTKAELGSIVGRGTPGVLAVNDTGLAAAFLRALDAELPGQYADAAALLDKRAARAAQRRDAGRQTGPAGAGGFRAKNGSEGDKGRKKQ
jgi:ribosomal protein L7Ae-like RNA K-turn-binding protein